MAAKDKPWRAKLIVDLIWQMNEMSALLFKARELDASDDSLAVIDTLLRLEPSLQIVRTRINRIVESLEEKV